MIIFHENFTTCVTLNNEVPIKFGKLSRSEVWIRTPDPDYILLGGDMRSLAVPVDHLRSGVVYKLGRVCLYVRVCLSVRR